MYQLQPENGLVLRLGRLYDVHHMMNVTLFIVFIVLYNYCYMSIVDCIQIDISLPPKLSQDRGTYTRGWQDSLKNSF